MRISTPFRLEMFVSRRCFGVLPPLHAHSYSYPPFPGILKFVVSRQLERMRSSKNMLIIISEDTSWDRGMLNFEIEKAIDYYKLPLIIAYTGYECILAPEKLSELWPKALSERINDNVARCIHIPFKEKAIMAAISQFSVHSTGDDVLTSPLTTYTEQTYINWGYR